MAVTLLAGVDAILRASPSGQNDDAFAVEPWRRRSGRRRRRCAGRRTEAVSARRGFVGLDERRGQDLRA